MRDKLEIVTYATHNERYFPILVESAKRNNLKLTVLGYGKKWNGFTDKFIGVLNYIKNKDPNLIVMFVDAFDVVFNNTTEQEILNKYNSFNKPIVFSVDMKNNYFFPKGFSKTINTGLYMGRVAYLNELLNNLMKFNVDEHNYFTDDQMLLNYYYKINNDDSKKNVAIDINYNLFWNIPECFFMLNELKNPINYIKDTYYYDDNKIKIIDNNNSPVVMQAPFANEIHDIIKDLNYNTNNINDVILYKPFKIFQAFGIVKHALYYNNNNVLLYNFIVIFIICFITYNVNLSKLKKILLFSILLLLWFLYLLIRRWE